MKQIKNYPHKYAVMSILTIIPVLISILFNISIRGQINVFIVLNNIITALSYLYFIIAVVLYFFKDKIKWFDKAYATIWAVILVCNDLVLMNKSKTPLFYIRPTDNFFFIRYVYKNIDANTIAKDISVFSFITCLSIISVGIICILSLINLIKEKNPNE